VAPDSPLLEPGLPVVVEPIKACGACPRCRSGEPNLCPQLKILGTRLPGGFAEAVLAPRSSVYALPDGLDLDAAVLAEPLAVAVHAVGLAGIEPGSEILVLGGGSIGLLTAFVAARAGGIVTLSARHPHQADAGRVLGATRIVATDRDAVLEATRDRQPDVVLETVGGDSSTVELALEAVRPGGAIVSVGLFTRPLTLHPLRFLAKEARVTASMMYSRKGDRPDFAAALAFLREEQGRLASLITHRVPLDAIGRGFAIAADKSSGALKVCVEPGQKL
jgi:2-desacetyl-2-hydroxyethyl bacteriochlorophyllide A dehydrogenase